MNPSPSAFTAPRLTFALAVVLAIGIGCSPPADPAASGGAGPGVGGNAGSGGAGAGVGGTSSSGGATPTSGGQTGSGGETAAGGSSSGTGGSVNVIGTISDLTVTPNPNSVLSVYVSWTTTEPSSSVVQFGEGSLTWQISGPDNVTEHEVLVIGLHASSAYMLHAFSTGASGTVTGDTEFATEALPPEVPEGTVSVNDLDQRQPGWTLMNVQKGNGEPSAYATAPGVAVIYDEGGKPVWYWKNGTVVERGGAISVDQTDVGVLMGPVQNIPNMVTAPTEVDWAGNQVWSCTDSMCEGTDLMSHHAGKLSNGNYIVMRDASVSGRTSQVFEEWTSANQQVHTIGLEDLITPYGGASGDWAHGNSITVDLEEDVAYLSCRWLGLIKATYSTKEIQWHLPADPLGGAVANGGDEITSSPKMAFDPPTSQFSDIHDPEIHDDGTILFFDNGGFTGQIAEGNPGSLHTRAVEYAIDEGGPTATLVWEWPGDFEVDAWYTTDLYVPFWGDADRLANGNVLITAGRRGTGAETPESRVIEVDKETGAVVWELKLPKDHGIYRSERIAPPLVTPIEQ